MKEALRSCEWLECGELATEQVGRRHYCAPHAEKVRRIRDAKFVRSPDQKPDQKLDPKPPARKP